MAPRLFATDATRPLRICVLLLLLVLITIAAGATASANPSFTIDCTGITSYPHLKDWDNSNAVDPNTIYLLNLYYSTTTSSDPVVDALVAGLRAALEAHSYTTDLGRSIQVVDVARATSSESQIALYITEAYCRFGERFFGVIGPFHDVRLIQLLDLGVLQDNTLVAFGPYTVSSTVRYYTPNVYFMRADPMAELLTMLNYIINHELHQRIGFAYLISSQFGDRELLKATEYVERVGSSVTGVYAGDGSSLEVDMEAFQKLVDSAPQSIIVYTSTGDHVNALLTLILSNEKLKNTEIFVPSFLNYELDAVADEIESELDSNGVPLHSANRDRLFSTATNYPAHDTSMEHIVAFRSDMTNYITVHVAEPYDSPEVIDKEPELADIMISGWTVGQAMLQIFRREHWLISRDTLIAGLFEQNRYIIEKDFVLGDYGGACASAVVAEQGAVCECNQGGRTTFLMRRAPDLPECAAAESVLTYSSSICYPESLKLPAPINMVTIRYADDEIFARIDSQLDTPAQLSAASLNTLALGVATESYNMRSATSTVDKAQEDLDIYMSNHRVDVIIGPVIWGTDTGDTLLLSPVYRKPRVAQPDLRTVTLRSTLDQQLYIICEFLTMSDHTAAAMKRSQMRLVLRDVDDQDAKQIAEQLKKTTETFRIKKPKTTTTTPTQTLDDVLEHNVVTFLMGLHDGDAEPLVRYLEKSPKSLVLLLCQDVMMYYEELVEAFSATTDDVRGRLVFSSSFPMWTDDSDAAHEQYPILKAFHEAMGGDAQYYTPRAFEAYITVRLVDVLASSLQVINASELRRQLYHTSNFFIDNFRLGPFTDCDTGSSIQDKNCVTRNYGANDISIVSMKSISDKSQTKVYGPTTPAMTYSKRPLSTSQIVAIAVCCGLILVACIALPIVICMCCCSSSRDNKNAPKSAEDPVTIIFTDIESSTALWGTVPQIMPDAVATHHKIIRETIAAHKSYEVKTVGDSFMIACKKPFAAVQIAQDIQKRFLAHDWEEDIDECYRQFEQRKAADPDNEDYKPPSANLSREVYDALWSGLRVRIGVHTGLSDIRQDEITGGFDYYGETSNMAARTEAIGNGGQVLLTDATWWALSQDERDSLDVTNLGEQQLRGVGFLVTMYQLDVVAGRSFGALRLDILAALPNEEDETDCSTEGKNSSAATLTGPAAAIAAVLTNCFSPYPPPRRIKELLPLLQKWGIPVPPRHRGIAEEDYCQGLLNRLALKMASVVQIRAKSDLAASSRGTPSVGASPTTPGSLQPFPSLIGVFNPFANPGDGLTKKQVARLRRSSRQSARSGHNYFLGTRSSVRSSTPSPQLTPTTDIVQLFPPSAPGEHDNAEDDDDDDDDAEHTHSFPPLQSVMVHRPRPGLAALSITTSVANSSVHVAMPEDFS